MQDTLIDQARRFYLGEIDDWQTYRLLARHSRDPQMAQLLERIAGMERRHADFWAGLLEREGVPLPAPRPRRLRFLLLRLLQRWINPLLLVAALELGESGAVSAYHRLWQSGQLPPDDCETLRGIILDELEHESAFRQQTKESGLQNVRDFVLGMNDGLVEILGAVTGLSAAYAGNPLLVAVSGLVVGIAGALSMGIGAFISVRSQRQVNQGARQRMEVLFGVAPERAVDEFRDKLREAGLPEDISEEVASRVGTNRESLSKLLLEETSENEWRSGLFTGAAYLFGVLFPVLPYFIADSALAALVGSVFFAGLALATVGGFIALVSGIDLRTKILEMLLSGLGAAGLAWLFGLLMQNVFGISV
ncbi:MAG TPA: rubrerythrin family protein [Gammaproteobacteria bacterium]|nr:rubrerythrin family protein [Gammaproteobacteria bacterium]